MVVNSHVAISGVTNRWISPLYPPPHPVCLGPLFVAQVEFFCRQVLDHMIWGGVLERHPGLRLVLTEQGSGWIPSKLEGMDYSYDGSYLRRDIRDVIRQRPSEYFARQCHIGSSLLTRAEVAIRHRIGVDKMMVGVDYPHHEGTWNGGTQNYFQATLGANNVPEEEARKMVGETAAAVFGFDVQRLAPIADRRSALRPRSRHPHPADRGPVPPGRRAQAAGRRQHRLTRTLASVIPDRVDGSLFRGLAWSWQSEADVSGSRWRPRWRW